LRQDLQASLSLTAAQRRLRESTEGSWTLLVTPAVQTGQREIMVILRGRLWAQLRVVETSSPDELACQLEKCWARFGLVGIGEPDHDSVDDMHILGSWLARHEGHPAIMAIDVVSGKPDWDALARQALGLGREQLDFDAWRKARDAGEGEWGESVSASAIAVESDT
jgi:hypothetical protein